MNRSFLSLAFMAGGLGLPFVQQATAAGFIEDSKSTLTLRNFYINQDTRNQDSPSVEEWGQGFIFNYESGFTEGPIGFGVDALGLYGIRLDSGGDQDKAGIERRPGSVFPTDDGEAVNEFGRLGLTGKIRVSRTVARFGTLLPKLPILTYNDGRLLPQTYEGMQVTSNELDDLTLIAGKLEHVADRNSSSMEGMTIQGANARQTSNSLVYGGADYRVRKDLLLQYYYGNLEDFYKQHFLGLTHDWQLPAGSLKTDLRYFHSDSDGANASASGRAAGYYANGYFADGSSRGEVDNRLWSAMFTYSLNGHALSAGYQQITGNSDFPHINQGEGRTLYLITNAQVGKFASAGERTWVAGYSYDFSRVGVPGLKASTTYFSGDDIDAAGSDRREWERDIRVDYVLQNGPLKGLGFTWRNAMWRGNDARDQDEHRLILSYSIPIL